MSTLFDDGPGDDELDSMDGIELEESEAAIIFKADGSIQHIMPHVDDDDEILEGTPAMQAAVVLYILSDPNRYKAIEEEFLIMAGAHEPTVLH